MATSTALPAAAEEARYDDFDVCGGCLFLTFMAPPTTVLGAPCSYCRMTSQEVYFEGNRLHFKYDCCLIKEDKLIPLDRIQDANIGATCCSRICGVSVLNIQTANGSQAPEAAIIAPRNAELLRSIIMERRDRVIHGEGGSASDGLGVATKSPVHGDTDHRASVLELQSVRGTLERIEQLMERGLQKMEIR